MKIADMNKNEKAAFIQVVNAANWVIGGYENSVSDGHIEEMPSREQLFKEIYDTVMTCTTFEGTQVFQPIREVRFAGAEFIKERIRRKLDREGYKDV